jgi:hypothetical protein
MNHSLFKSLVESKSFLCKSKKRWKVLSLPQSRAAIRVLVDLERHAFMPTQGF